MRKYLLVVVLFVVLFSGQDIFAQAGDYGIYMPIERETAFKESVDGDKSIAVVKKSDTIIVVDYKLDKFKRVYLETIIDGKQGYLDFGKSSNDEFKRIKKALKSDKKSPEQRLVLALEYDNVKRNSFDNIEIPILTVDYITAEVYNDLLEVVGEMNRKNTFVLYSMNSYPPRKFYTSPEIYYKAIWNNQDVLISYRAISSSYTKIPSDFREHLNAKMYIGENSRRESAIKKSKIIQQEQEEAKEKEQKLQQEKEAKEQAKIDLKNSYKFIVEEPAQKIGERSAVELPKINLMPIGTLTSATGWVLCEDGNWASRQNKIPTKFATTSPAMENSGPRALGAKNFSSINLYSFTYAGKEYILLTKKYKSGAFDYPTIAEGWSTFNKTDYFVFDKSELDNINLLNDGEPAVLTAKIMVQNSMSQNESGLQTIARDIIAAARSDMKYDIARKYSNYYLIIMTNKAKNKVYFIDQVNTLLTDFSNNLIENNKPGTDLLKERYYETSYTNFSKLLKLP